MASVHGACVDAARLTPLLSHCCPQMGLFPVEGERGHAREAGAPRVLDEGDEGG